MLLARAPKAMIGVLPNAPFMGGSEGASSAVGGNAPFRGGCSYSSVKRDSPFRWVFLAALTQDRPGLRPPPAVLRPLVHGFGIQAQFCAAFRYRPAHRDDVVAAPRGLAELQAMRRMTAAEVHRRLVSGCNGHGKRQALAGGRHWQVAGIGEALGGRHPWAGAKPLKGDPAMRLLGQEPLRRGRATGGRQDSCAVHDSRASDGESAPWRQDVRAVYSPTALCGAFWMHGAHILPKLAESEYMQAICCREPVFFPSEAPSGTHRGTILPWPAAWERTRAQSRHGRQLGNAPGRYLAMARRRMVATEVHRRPISDCNGVC